MSEIKIASFLSQNRRRKGVTQDELATYIGVSKSSVSKWETGQSFPDITFLPRLATYFGVSIDELMGYETQLSVSEIRELYVHLASEFSVKSFEEVFVHCRDIISRYYTCYPLLYQMGVLMINNSSLAAEDNVVDIITEAKQLFVKVKTESDDIDLSRKALNMEALALIMLNNPDATVKLLGESDLGVISSSKLLATAYSMIGNTIKAKEVLQIEIYQFLVALLQLLQSYLLLFIDDTASFEEIFNRFLSVAKVFNIEGLKPDEMLSFFILAAQGFMASGNEKQTLACLEEYSRLATVNIYPLQLQGDAFFSLLDDWFEQQPLGVNPPRDEKLIRQSILDAVANNPAFSALKDMGQFKRILKKLQENCGGNEK